MDGQVVIRDVQKRYGPFTALDNVSLDIEQGEFVTLLGPSGSGKTTLLNVLAGFTRPDSGSIRIDGTEFLTLPPHKRDLGMVFQSYALFPHMSVLKNVGYPLKLRKVAKAEIDRRARATLDVVKMGHLADRDIAALSGGQRQRVALARAMVFEPKILLMDEPLSALDKNLREHMQIELRRLHDRLGTTTVYVTHDQREALTMSDRIAVINNGRVVQYDTPSRLYDHPVNRFVAEFIGESGFLPVAVKNGTPDWRDADPRRLHAIRGAAAPGLLLIRPERLALARRGDAPRDALHQRRCQMREAIFPGRQPAARALSWPMADRSTPLRRPLPAKARTIRLGGASEISLLVAGADTVLVTDEEP